MKTIPQRCLKLLKNEEKYQEIINYVAQTQK